MCLCNTSGQVTQCIGICTAPVAGQACCLKATWTVPYNTGRSCFFAHSFILLLASFRLSPFPLQIKVRVSNQNYFKVTMNNLSISIDGPENVGICNYKGEKANSLTADALSSSEFSCQTIIMFKNDHAEQIQEACERSWAWNHFILILNTKVNWSYLIFDKSHIENIDWDCFTCRRGMFPTRQVKHSCYERNQNNTPSMVPLEPQIPITLTSSGLTWRA